MGNFHFHGKLLNIFLFLGDIFKELNPAFLGENVVGVDEEADQVEHFLFHDIVEFSYGDIVDVLLCGPEHLNAADHRSRDIHGLEHVFVWHKTHDLGKRRHRRQYILTVLLLFLLHFFFLRLLLLFLVLPLFIFLGLLYRVLLFEGG